VTLATWQKERLARLGIEPESEQPQSLRHRRDQDEPFHPEPSHPVAEHSLSPSEIRTWARETAAYAEGIGAIDALYEAVDALRDCEWCDCEWCDCEWCGLNENGGHERWCPVVN
jgi:hypothetical protein